MENTPTNRFMIKEVMADLRDKGARCCLIYTGHRERTFLEQYPDKDVRIRAVLKDGRVWDIHETKRHNGKNEAIVMCDTE